jgi:hypothetical protein
MGMVEWCLVALTLIVLAFCVARYQRRVIGLRPSARQAIRNSVSATSTVTMS